jgi:two-component system response regulator FlrC
MVLSMRLLVIGELNTGFNTAAKIAIDRGDQVCYASNINQALDNLRSGKGADLILIDASLDIANLASSLNNERINVPIVACSIKNNPSEAVKAINAGAKEYLPLPPDANLISSIFSAITDSHKPSFYNSEAMRDILNIVERVATSNANILITGNSGTGKEVIAGLIHKKSLRNHKSFIRVNCAAIPDNLLESELFGHEKGAFTGAATQRIGKFEESNGGTLLLDEISEMDVRLQAKLLRAIQEKEIDRVGGSHPVKVDLRIIATSNRNLLEEIKLGNFREDLYFRLNIINIQLPNLSDRKEDILDLANYFIAKYSNNNKLAIKPLSEEVKAKILEYNWPGNVRELENTMHRAILLSCDEEIMLKDLCLDLNQSHYSNLAPKTLEAIEKQVIFDTLKYCLGDLNNTANILGISITSLAEKLSVYTTDTARIALSNYR